MNTPFGKIYALETFRELMRLKKCVGAKHSSLNRPQEWQRLVLRDIFFTPAPGLRAQQLASLHERPRVFCASTAGSQHNRIEQSAVGSQQSAIGGR